MQNIVRSCAFCCREDRLLVVIGLCVREGGVVNRDRMTRDRKKKAIMQLYNVSSA